MHTCTQVVDPIFLEYALEVGGECLSGALEWGTAMICMYIGHADHDLPFILYNA